MHKKVNQNGKIAMQLQVSDQIKVF